MANYLTINGSGDMIEVTGLASSTGASDAGKIVQLDSTGKINATQLPTGIGADAVSVVASEAIAAGAFVNIYNNSGTPTCRNAIATGIGNQAHGYVLAAVSSGQTATVFFDDTNTSVTGQTPGTTLFLSDTTAGGTTSSIPTATGRIVQRVGVAASSTSIHTNIDNKPIIRA